jgi:hypothetical protein
MSRPLALVTEEWISKHLLLAARSYGSQAGLAKALGWNRQALNEAISGKRHPTKAMLRFLGVQTKRIYVKL